MKVVWQRGQVTVRDVYETLLAHRRIAYTTVMTMMRVLEDKGHLKKRQAERAHVYRPAKPEAVVVGSMVREFVERVFGGSAQPLLMHLVKGRQLTAEEIDEVSRLIKEAE